MENRCNGKRIKLDIDEAQTLTKPIDKKEPVPAPTVTEPEIASNEVETETSETEESTDKSGEPRSKKRRLSVGVALVGIGAAALVTLALSGIGGGEQDTQPATIAAPAPIVSSSAENSNAGDVRSKADDSETEESTAATTCEHEFSPVVEEHRVEATYKQVPIDEVTETVTEYHTVCNVCRELIDGQVLEHRDQTGHVGATTGVPMRVERVVSPARTDLVEDVAAHTERIVKSERCGLCGAERAIEPKIEIVFDEEG